MVNPIDPFTFASQIWAVVKQGGICYFKEGSKYILVHNFEPSFNHVEINSGFST